MEKLSNNLTPARVSAATWTTAAVITLAEDVREWHWVYAAIAVAQATQIVVARSRRVTRHARRVAVVLAIAIAMSGASSSVIAIADSMPGRQLWRGLGIGLGVVCLTLVAGAAASLAQPLLGLVRFRRLVWTSLGAFATVAIAHPWGRNATYGPTRVALITVIGAGAVAAIGAAALICRELRSIGRRAERYGVVAGALFAVGQLGGYLSEDVPTRSVVTMAFNVAVCGLVTSMMVHSDADELGRRLHRHSDRVLPRVTGFGFGALIALAGILVALTTTDPSADIIWWLGIAGATQFAVIVWAVATTIGTASLRGRIANRRLDAELRRAVRDEQIVPHYQPILRLSDGICVGFEALARWHHPTRGILDGTDFLPRAKESGLLATIDRQILQAVALDSALLLRPLAAERPFVSVNISPWRLEQHGFAVEILAGLDELGCQPKGLVIEVTETQAVVNWKALVENVARLQHHGVGLAIDDFGSFGNLGLLRDLNVDLVKIDGPLIQEAMASQRSLAIMRGVIQTAEASGAWVVAEGVEHFDWIPALAELGIAYVQGFGIGYPAPVTTAVGLDAWRG